MGKKIENDSVTVKTADLILELTLFLLTALVKQLRKDCSNKTVDHNLETDIIIVAYIN